MSVVRKFFGQFDMFAAPPSLRAKEEDKTSSLCSGVTSFLLSLFFAYVFINSATGVITYTKIDSVQTQSRLNFQEPVAESLLFAIRIGYLPFEIQRKYFHIGFFVIGQDGTNSTFQVQQCLPEQWKKFGDDYLTEYNRFSLQQFFCPKPQDYLTLKKVYYAPNSQFAVIFVKLCSSNISQFCESPSNQQQFIQSLNDIEGATFLQIYFLDQAINPSSKQPIQYFTNTDAQFAFTTKRGIISTIQFGSYTVQTDMSVFPVEDIQIKKGNFLHSFRQTSIQIDSPDDNFATIYLTMNRKHILVDRKVGKLDDMLSYSGGLFSIIIGFLAIFVSSFNKYRYELMVAEGIFHQDQDGNAIKQYDFSFLLYIKYTIFDWLSVLFCYQPKWDDCLIIDSTRDEANKQMDVSRLFRKIQSLQTAVNYLIRNKGLKDCLNLLKPQHLTQIIRNRLVLQYYNSIIQGKSSLNFQQYRVSHQILKFGLKILHNEQRQNRNKIYNLNSTEESFPKQNFHIDYNLLANKQYLLQVINGQFGQLSQEAQQIVLKDEQKLTELELSQAFFQMDQIQRSELVQKVPIKILYRLSKCKLLSDSSSDGQQDVKNRKKVVLNIVNPIMRNI